jgi:hypothetical protein
MDFLLIAYIHYHYKMDHPLVCGDESMFGVALIGYIFKSNGGFSA